MKLDKLEKYIQDSNLKIENSVFLKYTQRNKFLTGESDPKMVTV